MSLIVVALKRNHKVSPFNCGTSQLANWLQQIARQHQSKGISATYVLVDPAVPDTILGYYAINIRALVLIEGLPPDMAKRLPASAPALTLGRLAVDLKARGRRCGEQLLVDAMRRAKNVAQQVGGAFLFVDAKDATAAAFYRKYGFVALPSDSLTLCMRIADIPLLADATFD